MFGAICHVETWMKYRRWLLAGWNSDVNRLLKEDARRARKRRSQRGRWM